MVKRPLLLALLAAFLMLWGVDAWVASASSQAVTGALLRALNDNTPVRVAVRSAHLHPVFLTLTAEGIEVFDTATPGTRVLSAAHATVHPALLSWLRGRRDLRTLSLERVEIEIVKDFQGVFNWERLVQLKPSTEPLYGWKYQDWLFNLYERLRREASQPGQPRQPTPSTRFLINHLSLRGGAVLTDRFMEPLVVKNLEIRLDGLQWLKNGDTEWKALSVKGLFPAERRGDFNIHLRHRRAEVRGTVRLNRINLEPLMPLYASSSPVLFDKGFITLQSEMRLTAETIDSAHHLRLLDHQMHAAVPWSPQSTVVLQALNRHPVLDLRFTVNGQPTHPVFDGVVESLIKILEKDFDPTTLSLIRRRLQEETEKVSRQFGPSPPE